MKDWTFQELLDELSMPELFKMEQKLKTYIETRLRAEAREAQERANEYAEYVKNRNLHRAEERND